MDRLQVENPIYPLLSLISSMLLLISGLIFVRQFYFPWLLLALCVLYGLFGFLKVLLRSMLFFIPVSLLFFLTSFLFQRNLTTAIQIGGRIMLVSLTALPVLVIPQIKLTRNLNQLRCPRVVTLGMLIAIRFVPVLAAEIRQVRAAMKTRGARMSFTSFSCLYRAFLIPLLMRLISISDTLSLSLETRGFSLSQKETSIYKPVSFTLRDACYACLTAGLIVTMILAYLSGS